MAHALASEVTQKAEEDKLRMMGLLLELAQKWAYVVVKVLWLFVYHLEDYIDVASQETRAFC